MGNDSTKPPVETLPPLNTSDEVYKHITDQLNNNNVMLATIVNIHAAYSTGRCIHNEHTPNGLPGFYCYACKRSDYKYIIDCNDYGEGFGLLSLRLFGNYKNSYTFVVGPKPKIQLDTATIKHLKSITPAIQKIIKFRDLYVSKNIHNSKIDRCLISLNEYIDQYKSDMRDIESLEKINSIMNEIKTDNKPNNKSVNKEESKLVNKEESKLVNKEENKPDNKLIDKEHNTNANLGDVLDEFFKRDKVDDTEN